MPHYATEQIGPGRLGEVLAAHDQLLAAQPDEPWLHAEYADAGQRGQPDAALAAYDRALSLDPDNPSPHFNRAASSSACPGSRKHNGPGQPPPRTVPGLKGPRPAGGCWPGAFWG
jgi:tetratricopeptide (TPR) repeat protein